MPSGLAQRPSPARLREPSILLQWKEGLILRIAVRGWPSGFNLPLVKECGLGGVIFRIAKVVKADPDQAEALFRAQVHFFP